MIGQKMGPIRVQVSLKTLDSQGAITFTFLELLACYRTLPRSIECMLDGIAIIKDVA